MPAGRSPVGTEAVEVRLTSAQATPAVVTELAAPERASAAPVMQERLVANVPPVTADIRIARNVHVRAGNNSVLLRVLLGHVMTAAIGRPNLVPHSANCPGAWTNRPVAPMTGTISMTPAGARLRRPRTSCYGR